MSSVALLIHSFLSFCFVDSSLPSVLFVHSLALLYSFAPFRFIYSSDSFISFFLFLGVRYVVHLSQDGMERVEGLWGWLCR
ncbi:hypothetical protein GGU10DRAFT_366943, partial [Lentinula aff. detonsa]